MATVALLGTCDTKLEELLFLRDRIIHDGKAEVILVDVGRRSVQHEAIAISQNGLFTKYGDSRVPTDLERGDFITIISDYATREVKELYEQGRIHGMVSAGGSGGTSLAAAVMRNAVPIGFPKLIVSTIASGDTGPLVGETDITMMYSVVDIAGLNGLLREILRNAGVAIAAGACAYAASKKDADTTSSEAQTNQKKRVGITMFGVTTPGVDVIRKHLETNYPIEVYVFHATGHGGKAMERLVREGRLDAVLDLTTTEICDELTGGNMSAGPNRLEAALEAGIPYVISLGATDMTNFGPPETIPVKYQDRKLYKHNPVVTLMRTSEEEARQVAIFIADKLLKFGKDREMLEVWLPMGGLSMLSVPGAPFEDTEVDKVLFSTIKERLTRAGIGLWEHAGHINDPKFAESIAESLIWKMGLNPSRDEVMRMVQETADKQQG